ncbi:hypothetical protein WS62_10135 [Burkholderia sp. ABCPW 14]|uniref:hypothetical protein n=1 Tax=Burkholderia sp. ABCPW 14 TaxID=1637860 RepID=UPI000770CBD5|nr:hypothetical protein [Burkholderia sp. ABCPW 14]KVD71609.1 hypothetical protein WS62_10135 [Burkholderia sp. ABCPW 14]
MKYPDRPTSRNNLSALKNRYLRMPPPKMEAGQFGWAKRWFFDWLVPTGASAYAAYHLTVAFVRHYRTIMPPIAAHDVPLDVMSELMSLANSKYFAYASTALVATFIALLLHRLLKRPVPGNWLNRRRRPIIRPLPFTLGFLVGKLLAFAVPALAVAVAAYASEGAIWAIAPIAVPIAILSAAYYYLLYDEVRPPAIVSLSFHRPRQAAALSDETSSAPTVGIGAWRDAHTELQDDANAIADAAGGMCGQNVFVSHDIEDIAIAVALSIGDDHLSADRKRALDAQIDRVLRKWRAKGYESGSLYDARKTPDPAETSVPDDTFWLPESKRVVRHGTMLLKAQDGYDVRIIGDVVCSARAAGSRRHARQRRERTFEFD